MILSLTYISKDLCIFNQVRSRFIYLLSLGTISLYTRGLYFLINNLTFIKFNIKTIVLIKLISI